uniref:Ribosome production factor 2 homolog n=1 Tax=Blastobotrys adeninivorans TaxID=409370 RepID=A0A060T1L9_BLAAD
MLKAVAPKNARAKRALEKREPKLVENTKQALFVPGANANQLVTKALIDLHHLKKPDAKRFSKKNEIRPFEDASSLEFFSEKNDCSLLTFGSHNKKRPLNLTFARTFNYKIYDMIELRMDQFKSLDDFRKSTFAVGMKPMFVFQGPLFDSHPTYMQIKSLFLDFFRGDVIDKLDVAGLQHVISISAAELEEGDNAQLPLVHFRVYLLKTFKSDTPKQPRVELDEIGPRFDFRIGRVQPPDPEMEKEAMKKPKQLEPKTKKNVETDIMGDQLGRIHVGKQDLSKLQTRKMKGLKARFDQDHGEDEDEEDYSEPEDIDGLEAIVDELPAKKKQRTN